MRISLVADRINLVPRIFSFSENETLGKRLFVITINRITIQLSWACAMRSNFKGFFFVTHQCMASKTSVSFLVVCGIFLLIFLVALFFLLYYFLRRACLVKAIEIIHTEANQQQNQLSVDRLHVFTESNMTSISAPAVQNDHCKTSSFNVRQTLRKEDIEVTILWQEVLI